MGRVLQGLRHGRHVTLATRPPCPWRRISASGVWEGVRPRCSLSHDGDPRSRPAPGRGHPPPDGVPAAAPPWPAPCFASTPSDPGPTPSGRLRAALRPAPLPGGGPGCGHCWQGLASGPCPARPAGRCDRASVHEPGPQGLSSCAAVTPRRGFTFPRLQPALALYPRPWLLSRAGFPPSSAPTTLGPAPRLASKVQEPGPCEHQGGGAEAGGDHRGEGGTGVPQPSGGPLACCTPVPAPGERLTAPTQPRGRGDHLLWG